MHSTIQPTPDPPQRPRSVAGGESADEVRAEPSAPRPLQRVVSRSALLLDSVMRGDTEQFANLHIIAYVKYRPHDLMLDHF